LLLLLFIFLVLFVGVLRDTPEYNQEDDKRGQRQQHGDQSYDWLYDEKHYYI
jgi:hypothetical protein